MTSGNDAGIDCFDAQYRDFEIDSWQKLGGIKLKYDIWPADGSVLYVKQRHLLEN